MAKCVLALSKVSFQSEMHSGEASARSSRERLASRETVRQQERNQSEQKSAPVKTKKTTLTPRILRGSSVVV